MTNTTQKISATTLKQALRSADIIEINGDQYDNDSFNPRSNKLSCHNIAKGDWPTFTLEELESGDLEVEIFSKTPIAWLKKKAVAERFTELAHNCDLLIIDGRHTLVMDQDTQSWNDSGYALGLFGLDLSGEECNIVVTKLEAHEAILKEDEVTWLVNDRELKFVSFNKITTNRLELLAK